ncbi:MAG: hypothetical protein M2R45_02495 [Verrucomicrobia subdivision 3 bacterium]|nr:hypothetical protein [Limisphaerales bacterium]MCS1413285.1 hypothetical protein [Limisphaerales bacterium]
MPYHFRKHYSIGEARELLPKIQEWLEALLQLRDELSKVDHLLESRLKTGADLGGNIVNDQLRAIVKFQKILGEFRARDIQLKDLDRGLIDFPHLRAGEEVFLCWENGEEDIGYWHELDAGFAGREPL